MTSTCCVEYFVFVYDVSTVWGIGVISCINRNVRWIGHTYCNTVITLLQFPERRGTVFGVTNQFVSLGKCGSPVLPVCWPCNVDMVLLFWSTAFIFILQLY